MKKWMLVWVMLLGCVSVFHATTIDLSALDVCMEQAMLSAAKENLPPTGFDSADKQAAFDLYLEESIKIIEQRISDIFSQDDIKDDTKNNFLVYVLRNALETRLAFQAPNEIITEDQRRSVNYAIFMLMFEGTNKGKYTKYKLSLDYTPQYQQEHPVQNWQQYVADCQQSMDLFYDLLEELVNAKNQGETQLNALLNCAEWMSLTH